MLLRIQSKLSAAYSRLSLLSAFCHSQAPVDRHFQGYVTSIYPLHLSCLSIWSLPASVRPTRCKSWIWSYLFLQSNGSSQLVEQVFKRTGGRGQKSGANGLLPFFLTRIQIRGWARRLLHITDFGISVLLDQFWRHCICKLAIRLPICRLF